MESLVRRPRSLVLPSTHEPAFLKTWRKANSNELASFGGKVHFPPFLPWISEGRRRTVHAAPAVARSPPLAKMVSAHVQEIRSWLRVLKESTDIIDLPSDPTEIVYIHVETFHNGFGQKLEPDPRALEVLHLLTFLGELDHDAWKEAVRIAWPKHAKEVVRLSGGRVLQLGVRLGFNHNVEDEEICPFADWYSALLECTAPPTSWGGHYEQVLKSLEAAYAAAERDSSRRITKRADLTLPVRIVFFHGRYTERLKLLAEIARNESLRQTPVPVPGFVPGVDVWKPLLRIAEVCPGSSGSKSLSVDALKTLASLVEFGADIDAFAFDGLTYKESDTVTVTKALQQLMRTPTAGSRARPPITRTDVPGGLGRQAIQAIYSALQTGYAVKDLNGQADSTFAWQNIVYALFGRAATHQISRLTLWLDSLSMDDVAAVKTMVEHSNPLSVLLGSDQVETSDFVRYVTASTFHLTQSSSSSSVTLAPQEVRVLNETGGLVSVYLPGRGQAWVQPRDCSNRRIEPMVEGFGSRTMERVRINWMTNNLKDAVLALLRLVGRGIKTLAFESPIGTFDLMDDWFISLVEACPDLESLTIAGKFRSLDTITNAFHSGLYHLKTLKFRRVDVVDVSSATDFFLKFGDKEHPMTQRLRKFELIWCRWDLSPENLSSTLKEVLAVNRSLKFIRVSISLPTQNQHGDLERFTIREEDLTPITMRERALDLDKKLAFISATAASEASASSALDQLDSQIIPLIFEYAAECRTRRVIIDFNTWSH